MEKTIPSPFIHLRLAAGSLQSPAKQEAPAATGRAGSHLVHPPPQVKALFSVFQSSESVSSISGSSKNEGSSPIFGFPPDGCEF